MSVSHSLGEGDLLGVGDLLGRKGDLDLLCKGDFDLLIGDLEKDRLLLKGEILLLRAGNGDLLHLRGGDLEYLRDGGDLEYLLGGGEFLANPGGGLVGSKNGVTVGGDC